MELPWLAAPSLRAAPRAARFPFRSRPAPRSVPDRCWGFTADSAARGWDFSVGRERSRSKGTSKAAAGQLIQKIPRAELVRVEVSQQPPARCRELLPPLELVPAPWVSPLFADTTGHLHGTRFVPCVWARGGTALCRAVVLHRVLGARRRWCWVYLVDSGKSARTADTEGISGGRMLRIHCCVNL